MKPRLLLSTLLLSSLAVGTAFADPGPRHWPNPPQHHEDRDHHHRDRRDHDRHDRDHARDEHDRHDHDHDRHHRPDHDHHRGRHAGWVHGCPPGLVRHKDSCLRPRQLRKHHHLRVGDRYRPSEYRRAVDPRRYALEHRGNWNYYQDEDQIYRVDSHSNKVLSVVNILQAMSK